MKKNKKSNIIINILIVVVILGGASIFWYMQRTVPYWQCSEVYKRYKDVEGVRATYVKDYRVNDTLTVGVTLLEATTDSGWAKLVSKFNVPMEMVELAKSNPDIDIWVGQALKDRPEVLCDVSELNEEEAQELEIMTISMQMHTICIFHTCNKQERDAIFYEKIPANI
jgi:hypothetical protein